MRARDLLIPTHVLLIAAAGVVLLRVPSPAAATASFMALVGANLGLLRLAAHRAPAGPGAAPVARVGVFTALFLGVLGIVCYLSLASGTTLLHRALFLGLNLPMAVPACALLALSTLPRPARPEAVNALEPKELPMVSVVLATRNEPLDVVAMTLESVLALDHPSHRLEIFVSDNSDPGHPDPASLHASLARLAGGVAMRFLHRDGTAGAKARNLDLALARTTGEYVLLVDADSTLAPTSLRWAIAHLARHPETAHVQFHIATSNWQRNAFTFCAAYFTDVMLREIEGMRSTLGFAFNGGHNVLWRRSALDEVLPFEQHFRGVICQTEDYNASIRVALRGWRCEVLPIESWEWAPLGVGSFLKQWYRWGFGAQQGVFQYGGEVLRTERMTYGAKVAMLMAFLHFLSPFFTLAGSLWLSLRSLLGPAALANPGCVVYGLAAGTLAVLIFFFRSAPSHPNARLPARLAGMGVAAFGLLTLTMWKTAQSLLANITGRGLVWTVTAKQ